MILNRTKQGAWQSHPKRFVNNLSRSAVLLNPAKSYQSGQSQINIGPQTNRSILIQDRRRYERRQQSLKPLFNFRTERDRRQSSSPPSIDISI